MGRPDPVWLPFAYRAVTGLWAVALLAAVTYLAGYARHLRRSLEAKDDSAKKQAWPIRLLIAAADRWLLRDPRERASFHFAWQTVVRNPAHRLFLSAYVGVGTAIVLQGLATLMIGTGHRTPRDTTIALYSLPLVLSFFLLSGIRVLFTVPAELRANWTFQLAEDERRTLLLAGARKAVVAIAVLPLVLLVVAAYSWMWGWAAAILHALFVAALSALLLEALLWNFAKVPFTCSYHPGKVNVPTALLAYLMAFALYAYSMASLEYWLLLQPWRMAACLVIVGALLGLSVTCRQRFVEGELRLLFEDRPEPEVRTLGIG
jgi:hypothetical protein